MFNSDYEHLRAQASMRPDSTAAIAIISLEQAQYADRQRRQEKFKNKLRGLFSKKS